MSRDRATYAIERLDEYRWIVPRRRGMLTEGLIYASSKLIESIEHDPAVDQVANVAHLPGIVGRAMAMPDIHWGYGFPIGGVAAFHVDGGVISPGGVGFDINCGVRLLATRLVKEEVLPRVEDLLAWLERFIPTGLGKGHGEFKLGRRELSKVLSQGARWVVSRGMGTQEDLERTESRGLVRGADPKALSDRALERGRDQLGTLGSGNHFCEVGFVERVMDPAAAEVLGLQPGQVTVVLHTGSRGLGYQVCQDNLRVMAKASGRYGISLPDRQLAAAPLGSPEAEAYMAAMNGAANFAYANRQALTHFVRRAFEKAMHLSPREHGIRVVYDVSHNLARMEVHEVDGEPVELCVHRKGATRAFPPGHPEVPRVYRAIGQPVIIPGDMGRYSYVLLGTEAAARETFGSVCHGAGRLLSRSKAKKRGRGRDIHGELARIGVRVRVHGRETLQEEMPEAYKDVEQVVDAVEGAGLAKVVARLRPMAVLKG